MTFTRALQIRRLRSRDEMHDPVRRGVRRPNRDRLRLEVSGALVGLRRLGPHLVAHRRGQEGAVRGLDVPRVPTGVMIDNATVDKVRETLRLKRTK